MTQAVNSTEAPGSLTKVVARRTLLIGMGTTGACICNQIMERLTWEYDRPENVPWIRCVVLETKELPPQLQLLRDNANTRSVSLALSQSEYGSLLSSPHTWDEQMGFNTWNIPQLTNTRDAFTDGANNVRIIGRIGLLYPPRFLETHEAITGALGVLKALDAKKVSAQFSVAAAENVQVDFGNDIYVYVVGTLCGGTSSGGFIDMGYLLRNLHGYEPKTTGIFLLPSQAHKNEKHTANTYAALLELNHYSSDRSHYRQQFGNIGMSQIQVGTRPYDYLYLIQARGEQDIEYARLVTAAADYIYSDVIGGTANERDGKRTNIADWFTQRDLWGATQKFFTFGMGSLEFPYTKVAKACSLRLTAQGLRTILGAENQATTQTDSFLDETKLLRVDEMMGQLLLRDDTKTRVDADIEGILNAARKATTTAELDGVRGKVDMAFTIEERGATHERLPRNIVRKTIDANLRRVSEKLQSDLMLSTANFLTGTNPRGVQNLILYLHALEKRLGERIKECNSYVLDESANKRAGLARSQAYECEQDMFLGAALTKTHFVRQYLNTCITACNLYYRMRLNAACAPDCSTIYQESLRLVKSVLNRIENSQCGLKRQIESLLEQLEACYVRTDVPTDQTTDGSVRTINGVELFVQRQTIDEEYRRCLREKALSEKRPGDFDVWERVMALETVQTTYIRDALTDITCDPNMVTRFDQEATRTLPQYNDHQLLEFARPARASFTTLKRRSILERLLKSEELPIHLRKADTASQLFLDWQDHPRHRIAVNKTYKFVYFYNRDPRATEMQQKIVDAGLLQGQQSSTAFINDPHQIMVLQERGAFSLGTIRELMEGESSKWRNDYHDPTIPSFHSRGDVSDWISWERADETSRSRIRNLFLVGVALNIIDSSGVTNYVFCYQPKQFGELGRAEMSNDLDANYQTMKAKGIDHDIQIRIQQERDNNGPVDVFKRIKTFAGESNNKFSEGGQNLKQSEINSYLLDFISDDTELMECYRREFPDAAELKYLGKDKDNKRAYICPYCNNVLGNNASDLYIERELHGKRVRMRECALCHHSL